MELILAIAIALLGAAGLGLGLAFGRPPVTSSCGGMDCVPGPACDDCPNRLRREGSR